MSGIIFPGIIEIANASLVFFILGVAVGYLEQPLGAFTLFIKGIFISAITSLYKKFDFRDYITKNTAESKSRTKLVRFIFYISTAVLVVLLNYALLSGLRRVFIFFFLFSGYFLGGKITFLKLRELLYKFFTSLFELICSAYYYCVFPIRAINNLLFSIFRALHRKAVIKIKKKSSARIKKEKYNLARKYFKYLDNSM